MRPRATHSLTNSPPPMLGGRGTGGTGGRDKHIYAHTATSHKVKSFSRVQTRSQAPQIYMNLRQAPDREEKRWLLAVFPPRVRVCALSRTRVLITQHLRQRVCAVSLSLLLAILNLAVWCAPATCDLSAATARHDTH